MHSLGIVASSFYASPGGTPSTGFVSTAGSTANATTYTFTSQSIGVAGTDRRIVVAVANRDTGAYPASVTVGGQNLNMDVGRSNVQFASIWSGIIPTGTLATIVVSYTVANTYCGIGVWNVYGPACAWAPGPATSATPALSVPTVSGDFVIAALAYRATVAAASVAWNAMSERYDAAVDGAVRMHSGADLVASGASVDAGSTITNYSAESALSAAAYRTYTGTTGGLTGAYLQTAVDTTDATTYTFTSQNIGTAASDRIVVVGVTGRGTVAQLVTGVTIGGVTATQAALRPTAVTSPVSFWYAAVPTGTTATVVVTYTGTMLRCVISMWGITGGADLYDNGGGVDTVYVTQPSGGFTVAMANTASGSSTYTWTGATERYDATVEAANNISSADSTTSGFNTIVATPTTASSNGVAVAVFA